MSSPISAQPVSKQFGGHKPYVRATGAQDKSIFSSLKILFTSNFPWFGVFFLWASKH